MNQDKFEMTWQVLTSICHTAQYIPIEDVEQLLTTIRISEAIGPLIEPTMYMRGGADNLDDQREIAQGFLAFRKAIDKVMERAKEKRKT